MLRLALQPDTFDNDTEESVTVGEAARRLGCDDATVRALLRAGELTGHKIGKASRDARSGAKKPPRGVRVHARAIHAYKARHAIGGGLRFAIDPVPAPQTVPTSSAIKAKRRLRQLGILR